MDQPETIDIEALLIRAYREKQIDRLGGDAAKRGALGMGRGPRAPRSAMGGGERVDTSSYAARMAAELREMYGRLANAPDALLTVHDAVLALPDAYVELTVGAEFRLWDAETARALDHRVDAPKGEPATLTPGRWVPALGAKGEAGAEKFVPLAPAIRVQAVVTAPLLVIHGRAADRPFVSPLEVEGWRTYRDAHGHPVERVPVYVIRPADVALERATYSVWRAALSILTEALCDLPGYQVTGPQAEAEPWANEARVLTSQLVSRKSMSNRPNSDKTPRRLAKSG